MKIDSEKRFSGKTYFYTIASRSSGTGGSVNGIYTLETREGGYLVIMDSSGNTIWSTPEKDGAWSTSSPYALLLDDGNLYLYGSAEELWKARKYKLENTLRIVD